MRYCDHTFLITCREKSSEILIRTDMAVVVCVHCGHVRSIDSEGNIVILKEQGTVTKKLYHADAGNY